MTTETTENMLDLAEMARQDPVRFRGISYEQCVQSVRAHLEAERQRLRGQHNSGVSGHNTLRGFTSLCDSIVKSAAAFALSRCKNPQILLSRVSICALGGYGRGEMSPCSDLDVSLLFDNVFDSEIEAVNGFLTPFFWDIGLHAGYTLHSVREAAELAVKDPRVFTSYAQARLVVGDNTTLGRLKLSLSDLGDQARSSVMRYVRQRENRMELPPEHRDVFALEPNIKESAGGLRDFHAGLWMIMITHGAMGLDDMARLGHVTPVEHLELLDGLDFLWRVRNELHFHTGREEDRLSFAMQRHAARFFGYGDDSAGAVVRFMEDYYQAASSVRRFLQIAARICDQAPMSEMFVQHPAGRSKITVYSGHLCVDPSDKNWFAENPTRLMEIFWECARRTTPLAPSTGHWVRNSLGLVNDAFRSNDVVRRYFIAICNRPLQAGAALREAAGSGLLGAYLPEYEAIRGVLCYEDFHSFPVDEHTLRALEALGQIPRMKGDVAMFLYRVLERVRDPHVLVLAVLLHDLGKVAGEIHVAEGARIAGEICARINLSEYDTQRIVYLVNNHMAMSDIAFYRDTDDMEIVQAFAQGVKTDDMLRMLLLLTYADLSAVGPNVWNEWKGALLIKLFLKAERILMGRDDFSPDDEWLEAKGRKAVESLPEERRAAMENHLQRLGERYLLAFSPEQMALHLDCVEQAASDGLALRCVGHEDTGTTEVVVCTRDRHGLFSEIAGCFTAQLVSVQNAVLFTRSDGWVVDCFMVEDAAKHRPLTQNELDSVGNLLRKVILDGHDVRKHVEKSKHRLFALQTPPLAVKTTVELDNDASKSDTVIDIVTGDRTGLLYDISSTLSGMGIDFSTAHIRTDVGRVRDSFYVRMNGNKIEGHTLRDFVRQRLLDAIGPVAAIETREENVK